MTARETDIPVAGMTYAAPGAMLRAVTIALMETGVFRCVFIAGVYLDANRDGQPTGTSGGAGDLDYPLCERELLAEVRRRASELEGLLDAREKEEKADV